MHFEEVSLEKVKEQIARGEISLMPSSYDAPESWEEDSVRDDLRGAEESHSQKEEEPWRRLCETAALEQDPNKLLTLVEEMNRLLEKKQQA